MSFVPKSQKKKTQKYLYRRRSFPAARKHYDTAPRPSHYKTAHDVVRASTKVHVILVDKARRENRTPNLSYTKAPLYLLSYPG